MIIISKNGAKIPLEEASISIFDIGVSRGIAAFELLRTYNSSPFGLEEHIVKLFKAADLLSLDIAFTKGELREHIFALLKERKGAESQIKLMLFGRKEVSRLVPNRSSHLFIVITDIDAFERKPLALATIHNNRILPSIKTTSYAEASVALCRAKKQGYDDILYVNEKGHIMESSTSNIFFAKGNVLFTPHGPILEGVTRGMILQKLKSHFSFVEGPILKTELHRFEEAFLTSSVREIFSIRQIDNQPFISDGPIFSKVKEYYEELCYSTATSSSIN